jgi:hypothetical protein
LTNESAAHLHPRTDRHWDERRCFGSRTEHHGTSASWIRHCCRWYGIEGQLPFSPALTLRKAIMRMGSFGGYAPKFLYVRRGSERIQFTLKEIFADRLHGFQLQSGDIIEYAPHIVIQYAQKNKTVTTVDVDWVEDLLLTTAIKRSEMFKEEPRGLSATLVRGNQRTVWNPKDLWTGHSHPPPLKPGDIVEIVE